MEFSSLNDAENVALADIDQDMDQDSVAAQSSTYEDDVVGPSDALAQQTDHDNIHANKNGQLADISIDAKTDETQSHFFKTENREQLSWLFKIIFFFNILIMVDSGAIPASLSAMETEMTLSFTEMGALGSLVYVGLTCSSLFAGSWLQKYTERNILVVSIGINGLFCLVFGLSDSTLMLLIARTITGASQAFLVIFAPCWVDAFAPDDSGTLWMAMLQLSNPLGIMLGYVFGIIADGKFITDTWGAWRVVFIIQGCVVMLLAASLLLIRADLFAIKNGAPPPVVVQSSAKKDTGNDTELNTSGFEHTSTAPLVRSSVVTRGADSHRHSSLFMAEIMPRSSLESHASSRGDVDSNGVAQDNTFATRQARVSSFANAFAGRPRLESVDIFALTGAETLVQESVHDGSFSSSSRAHGFEDDDNGDGNLLTDLDLNSPHPSHDERSSSFSFNTASTGSGQPSVKAQLAILLSNPIYVLIVATLSALYFVVTGIQFWITPYLVDEIGADIGLVGISFVICSATGPTLGVVFGGWLIDHIGGYSGAAQLFKALQVCACFVFVALVGCVFAAFLQSFWPTIILIWIVLFAGGAIVPACTAITIDITPASMRPLGSAVAQISYNLFGYALSPILTGYFMEAAGSVTFGFQSVLLWSFWAAICLWAAFVYSYRQLHPSNMSSDFQHLHNPN